MPEFTPYPDENSDDFAKRMQRQTKRGGMVRAANRYMQTYEMRKKEKEKSS